MHPEELSAQEPIKQVPEKRIPVAPAKLPEHSRAAAAQRLSDLPEQPVHGAYCEAAHSPIYPPGWRTKRHIKRKNLRQTNLRSAAVERIGTQWKMMPMMISTLIIFLVAVTVFATFTAVVNATQKR